MGVEPKTESEHLNIKVVGPDKNEIHFKIKKHTSFKKLMDAYCERQGVAPDTVRFLFDGDRLTGEQTPNDVDMNDGDSVDALLHQVGGYFKK